MPGVPCPAARAPWAMVHGPVHARHVYGPTSLSCSSPLLHACCQELCLRSPALEDLQLRPSFEDVVDEYVELDHEAHARWEDCGRAQVQEAVGPLTEAVKQQADERKLGEGDGGCGGQGQAAAEGRSSRLRPHVRVELLRPVAWWENDWKEVE